MNIHEYQAKKILAKFKVPVPQGAEAFSVDEICKVGEALACDILVLKAQIHAGGRGKGGGVKIVKSLSQLREEATKMLGMTLITPQTGAQGKVVKRLYVEKASDIAKEYYLGMVVDRQSSSISFIASTEGGMEIEEVAHKHPEKIITINVDPAMSMQPFHARKIAYALGLDGDQIKKFVSFVTNLYEAFVANDASQVEINPLVLTKQGEFIALDAKFNFDDNALFRHPDIMSLRDEEEEEPLEKRALEAGLSYVKMEGDIGCMVNGAGLAMATMDIIKLYGKEPANFLDVGGGATKEKVTEAFKIIVSDKNVKGILVNIFGGIMKCDIIAQGIIAAAKEISLNVPLVVRLAGTNFSEGKALLDNSGLKLISADNLSDAADKIVKAI
jgi:succinyl-CoA synthetase beta subunit